MLKSLHCHCRAAKAGILAALGVALITGGLPTVAHAQDRRPTPARQPADGGARLTLTSDVLDFGTSYDESALEGAIKFTNTGNSTLVIQNIRASCGCTTTALTKREYAPGESGEVGITFKPKGSGIQAKTVTLTTNDPTRPSTVVRVQVNMVPVIDIKSPTLRMGQVEQGNEHVVPMELFSRDPSFSIASITFDKDQYVTWRLAEDAKPAIANPDMPGYERVEFVVSPDAPPGNFNRTMTVVLRAAATGDEPQRDMTYTVRMFGVILGDIALQPRFMRIPRVDPGGEFQASVVLTSRSSTPFEITSANVPQRNMWLKNIEVTYEPVSIGNKAGWRIIATGEANTRVGAFRGEIVVKTTNPREPEVTIPFNGQVRSAQPQRPTPRPTPRPRPQPRPR